MSLFLPNIPQAGDNLDFSQGQLLSNNQGLDTVFGIDHYTFSNATANKGFHNQVTTPAHGGGEPTTAANLPLLYALSVGGNLGVLQFTKGPNIANTFPGSPITNVQSKSAATTILAGGFDNVLDFTGLNRSFCIIAASNNSAPIKRYLGYVVWTGSSLTVDNIVGGTNQFGAFASLNILQIFNTSVSNYTDVYWTLEILRVQ